MTITHTNLKAKLLFSVVESSAVYYLYMSVHTLCGRTVCAAAVMFSSRRLAAADVTRWNWHCCPLCTHVHAASVEGDRFMYNIHIDILAYIILYIGVIIVVSTKTNNFTPIPCVFPGIWKYIRGRPCPCLYGRPGLLTLYLETMGSNPPRDENSHYITYTYIYSYTWKRLPHFALYMLFRRPRTVPEDV